MNTYRTVVRVVVEVEAVDAQEAKLIAESDVERRLRYTGHTTGRAPRIVQVEATNATKEKR